MTYLSNLMLSDYIQAESVYRCRSVNCIVINVCVCRTVVIVYSPRNAYSLKACFHVPPFHSKRSSLCCRFPCILG